MRGIGNTQFFGSPGVQLYVDGVPQAMFSLTALIFTIWKQSKFSKVHKEADLGNLHPEVQLI